MCRRIRRIATVTFILFYFNRNVLSEKLLAEMHSAEPSMSTVCFVNVMVNVHWLFHHYICDRFCSVCVTVVCMPFNRAPAYMQYMDIVMHGLERFIDIQFAAFRDL